jgi:methylated-DNA-protein-cysteine methyltransferase-like protein
MRIPLKRSSKTTAGAFKPPHRFSKNLERDARILQLVRSIPKGKVSSYSAVAAAAGYPGCHRLVAQLLRKSGGALPWQRVLGADGSIRLRGPSALEQRTRLEFEGVAFKGARVDLDRHAHTFRTWLPD